MRFVFVPAHALAHAIVDLGRREEFVEVIKTFMLICLGGGRVLGLHDF
jgi:hypothetical protein